MMLFTAQQLANVPLHRRLARDLNSETSYSSRSKPSDQLIIDKMKLTKREFIDRALTGGIVAVALFTTSFPGKAAPLTREAAQAIAVSAYVYFYPLVSMDITRKQATNIEAGKETLKGPPNTFSNASAYPPGDLKIVVRVNFDTLYSVAWLDLTKEPMVVSAPDTDGRYYLLPMLDMWTDVFASPGWRTTGTAGRQFSRHAARLGTGTVPGGVYAHRLHRPLTSWIIGRTKTDGPADYRRGA